MSKRERTFTFFRKLRRQVFWAVFQSANWGMCHFGFHACASTPQFMNASRRIDIYILEKTTTFKCQLKKRGVGNGLWMRVTSNGTTRSSSKLHLLYIGSQNTWNYLGKREAFRKMCLGEPPSGTVETSFCLTNQPLVLPQVDEHTRKGTSQMKAIYAWRYAKRYVASVLFMVQKNFSCGVGLR